MTAIEKVKFLINILLGSYSILEATGNMTEKDKKVKAICKKIMNENEHSEILKLLNEMKKVVD